MTVIVVATVSDPEALVVALWGAVEVPPTVAPLEAPAGTDVEIPPPRLVEDDASMVLTEEEPVFVTERLIPNV